MVNNIPNIMDDQSSVLNSMVAQIAKEIRAEQMICYGPGQITILSGVTFLEATDEAQICLV